MQQDPQQLADRPQWAELQLLVVLPQPRLGIKLVEPLAQQEPQEQLAFQVQALTCQVQEPPIKVEQAQVLHINQEQGTNQEQEDTNRALAHHSSQAQADINRDLASHQELA